MKLIVLLLSLILSIGSLSAEKYTLHQVDSTLCAMHDFVLNAKLDLKNATRKQLSENIINRCRKQVHLVDSVCFDFVEDVFKDQGWPHGLSFKATESIWRIIEDSDLKTMHKYFPVLEKAAKRGDITPFDLATALDRKRVRARKRQKYGTQIFSYFDNSGAKRYYMWPINRVENVDKRRAEIGLGPIKDEIADYKMSGIVLIWNMEADCATLPYEF